jgi:Fe-S cluster assembly iron-binding protein IscA
MVLVTNRAAEVLRATLLKSDPEPGQTLRLVPRPEGHFRLRLDREREGDQVVKAAGEKILVMSPDAAEALSGAVIDIRDTDEGPKLAVRD